MEMQTIQDWLIVSETRFIKNKENKRSVGIALYPLTS